MKKLTGIIIRTQDPYTAVVELKSWKKHPVIGKRYQTSVKILADCAGVKVEEGQTVILEPTRPRSRRKSWRISPAKGENVAA